jgi:uroporphyrinogen decarboxylase
MTDKENAREIIRFGSPRKITEGPPCHDVAYRGCNHEGYEGGGHHLPVGSRWTDIWGTGWHLEHPGVMGFPRGNPLADLVPSLRTYRWPDPDDERICGRIYESSCGGIFEQTFLAGHHRDTLWEKTYMLLGMENALCCFTEEPRALCEVLHRIMDFQLGIAAHYARVGVEIAFLGDDLGTQRGLLMSPAMMQEFLVPEYRRLFNFYRERRIPIMFHSCGHIEPVLDMFLDLGVDILNPVQANANDLDRVRAKTAGRLCLLGGVGSPTLMSGPPARIRREVGLRLWQLGRNGGYFCAPDQGMPWPEENIRAFHEAVAELGRYPIPEPDSPSEIG